MIYTEYLQAVYVGGDETLKGKRCLLRETEHPTIVEVQFHDTELPEAFGWHRFCSSVFQVLK